MKANHKSRLQDIKLVKETKVDNTQRKPLHTLAGAVQMCAFLAGE